MGWFERQEHFEETEEIIECVFTFRLFVSMSKQNHSHLYNFMATKCLSNIFLHYRFDRNKNRESKKLKRSVIHDVVLQIPESIYINIQTFQ